MLTFQEILRKLNHYWETQGCIIHQGYDLEVGAGTFNPATFLRCLGPEPYRAAYIEPSRRPTDGRYGENPIRMQHYFQYQVVLKPSPPNILDLYLKSLETIGFDLSKHDIRFVHDDWESPTLGAWGLGWEVWMDGMEVSQFTYFQSVGGQELKPITGEITYGIERLSTFLQGVDSTFDLAWSGDVTYGDIYKRNEQEWSHYNFEESNAEMWFKHFEDFEKEAKRLIEKKWPLPAYDFVMKASHAFNMLDARGVISVSERNGYIGRIRELARLVAKGYVDSREQLQFPLLNRFKEIAKEIPAPKDTFVPSAVQTPQDFLLEIGVEELPAIFVPIGEEGLKKALENFLKGHEIPYKSIKTYATPRRLAAVIEALPSFKPARRVEKRGPRLESAYTPEGTLTHAGKGFFESVKCAPLSKEEVKNSQGNVVVKLHQGVEYLYASLEEAPVALASLLEKSLPSLIEGLDFPKKMRWGSESMLFPRPLRWIVALHGETIIPFTIAGITSSRFTYGHRQLSPQLFPLSNASSYADTLREHFVIANVQERKELILKQLHEVEKKIQGKAISLDKVLPQVLHLVEWPFVIATDFDPAYLKAPKEILVSEMVEHQKYFPVENEAGELKNYFIITANNTPSELILKGNQKVLSARLKDGAFLYEQDLKIPLSEFNEKLKHVTFMKGLGSLHDKVERLESHVKALVETLPIANEEEAVLAATLCKCDLASHVVYEFPELQGMMGRLYALHAKIPPATAEAIEEHWRPRGEHAPLPETPLGTLLSLADKMDNLISCFALGLHPSSSSDPYALRRQTLGLIRILIRGRYSLPLKKMLSNCFMAFSSFTPKDPNWQDELLRFIQVRIKTIFQEFGLKGDEIEASLSSGVDDIYDLFCRIQSLHEFRLHNPAFAPLYEAHRRAKGQLAEATPGGFDLSMAKEDAEKGLYHQVNQVEQSLDASLATKNYPAAFETLALLQPPLAKLFDEVRILDPDPSLAKNRLALLQKVCGQFQRLLDFSKIQKT